jgi:hypothetical protein
MENTLAHVISESILKQAVIENHDREMAEIPDNDALAKLYTFSERHEARMKALFAQVQRKETRVKIYKATRRIAAVIILVTAVLFGALLINSDVRAAVRQVIIEWYERYTRFSFSGSGEDVGKTVEWYPSYLPEGFDAAETLNMIGLTVVTFINGSGETIKFEYGLADEIGISVDNERAVYETITDGVVEYHVFYGKTDEDRSKVIWGNDDYAFLMMSLIDADELIKTAFSVIEK